MNNIGSQFTHALQWLADYFAPPKYDIIIRRKGLNEVRRFSSVEDMIAEASTLCVCSRHVTRAILGREYRKMLSSAFYASTWHGRCSKEELEWLKQNEVLSLRGLWSCVDPSKEQLTVYN